MLKSRPRELKSNNTEVSSLMRTNQGHHECEMFTGTNHESAESEWKWKSCVKNPGHEKFISATDFKEHYVPKLQTAEQRRGLRAMIDLTVRLRVYHTSLHRHDDDELSRMRGSSNLRLGTGFIDIVSDPESNKPCPCVPCDGKVLKKYWSFYVRTAYHVVYNTEEATQTKVDLFYDDDWSERAGRMKSVQGSEIVMRDRGRDLCVMLCVFHDEEVAEKLISARRCWYTSVRLQDPPDLIGLNLLPFDRSRDRFPALIVSHPHGQPKKIAVGEVRHPDKEDHLVTYDTPTCPGSSGAAISVFDSHLKNFRYLWWVTSVHSGTCTPEAPVDDQGSDDQGLDDQGSNNLMERFYYILGKERILAGQLNFGFHS